MVVLISGGGSNLQAFIDGQRSGWLPIDIRVVVSNRADAYGLQRAEAAGITTGILKPSEFDDRESYDAALGDLIEKYSPGLIVMAGFMRILSASFVSRFKGRMLNIHPSLLPKYRGLNPHKRALENGDAVHGASVHFVTEELDGGPVLMQREVPVKHGDTEQELAARVQQVEHRIYPEAVQLFATGRVEMRGNSILVDGKPLEKPL